MYFTFVGAELVSTADAAVDLIQEIIIAENDQVQWNIFGHSWCYYTIYFFLAKIYQEVLKSYVEKVQFLSFKQQVPFQGGQKDTASSPVDC